MIVQLLIATAMAFGTADTLDVVRDVAPPEYAVRPPVTLSDTMTAITEVELDDTVVLSGEAVYPEEVVHAGAVWNSGDTVAYAVDGNGNEVAIEPGGVLRTECEKQCQVSGCNDEEGYYACCWWDFDGCAHCTCVPDGKLPAPGIGCSSGGQPADGCAMGGDTMEPRVPRSDDGKR